MEKQYSLYPWFKWLGNPVRDVRFIFFFKEEGKYTGEVDYAVYLFLFINFYSGKMHGLICENLILQTLNTSIQDRPPQKAKNKINKESKMKNEK
ncbi:MAG: hypothetical protein ABFD00_08130 [Chloroherpetonaceae bacterium]